jgi:hypothetical protein
MNASRVRARMCARIGAAIDTGLGALNDFAEWTLDEFTNHGIGWRRVAMK